MDSFVFEQDTIFESVLMPFAKNYQNQSVLVETTACQIRQVVIETLAILHRRPIAINRCMP